MTTVWVRFLRPRTDLLQRGQQPTLTPGERARGRPEAYAHEGQAMQVVLGSAIPGRRLLLTAPFLLMGEDYPSAESALPIHQGYPVLVRPSQETRTIQRLIGQEAFEVRPRLAFRSTGGPWDAYDARLLHGVAPRVEPVLSSTLGGLPYELRTQAVQLMREAVAPLLQAERERAATLREAIPLAQEEPSFRRHQLEAEAQAAEAPIAHFEAFFSSVEAVRPQDYTLGNAVRLHAATETTH